MKTIRNSIVTMLCIVCLLFSAFAIISASVNIMAFADTTNNYYTE